MTNLDRIPRYAFEAGFRVALIPSENINIKIVGNGFEARETSEVVHEEYDISWKDVPKLEDAMSLTGHDFVRRKLTSKEDYRASAKNRLDFLVDACGFPAHLVLDFLPMTEYTKIGEATEAKILEIALKDTSEPRIIYGEVIGGHVKTWEHSYNTPTVWF